MEAVLSKIEAEITLGTFDYCRSFPNSEMAKRLAQQQPIPGAGADGSPLFRDFANQWKRDKSVEWRESYRASLDSIFNAHLLPAFGSMPISGITRENILAFRADLASKKIGQGNGQADRKVTATTVNRVMGILRQILDEAVLRHGIINPLVKIKRLKQQRIDIQPFTIDEVRRIVAEVRPDYRNYLTIRFFTGMRSGEVNGLKWKHVDFDRRQILVRETFVNGRSEYTKTDGSQP